MTLSSEYGLIHAGGHVNDASGTEQDAGIGRCCRCTVSSKPALGSRTLTVRPYGCYYKERCSAE